MNNNTEKKLEDNKKPFTVSAPAVTLPKGGGAIRGIGEKFGANPVTGTGSLSVPIATSPGRSGFGPQLSLSYDSGSGNGPFGFGWNLFLPSITRKTDKGIPRYRDAEESDVFILSGAEDLVPVLIEKNGKWEREKLPPRTADRKEYKIQRYRPRIEGLFARIERWTDQADPRDTFWRSISKDNITSWYGKTPESRIADTTDPARIFSWMICESYDDKGNAIVYEYVPEDSSGIDLSLAHEQNRTSTGRSSNRYLKRIKYGNLPSRLVEPDLSKLKWLFEVVFDYDEKHYDVLPQDPSGHVFVRVKNKVKGDAIDGDRARQWIVRQDPFSTYRAGFEIRTYRLCRRVLMFHHFPDELGIDDYLVRSTEFSYEQSAIASFITSVMQSGYVLKPGDKFLKKSLPPLEFDYSKAKIDETVREVDSESLENLPYGLDGSTYQWVDLDGEGISGIITEQAGHWYYKRNVSANNVVKDNGAKRTAPKFAPAESVAAKPNAALAGGRSQFMDLAGDGQVDLVSFEKPLPGLYERTDEADWETFRPFSSWPNINMRDSNLKFVDLDGDGHADILIAEDDAFTWYPSLAEKGFGPALRVSVRLDEERGPRLVLADGTESVYLADLSGDGLTDLVRIRNGEVCYWPNVGYGKFGAKVTMDNAPWFDRPDSFDQKRVRLADLDGSGTTDIIYLGAHRIDIYRNEVGNSWAARESLSSFPQIDNLSSVAAIDLLGNGNACLVWSSPLPSNARRPMRYIDLMCGQKPHLLLKSVNNLGAETRVHYAPSTKFYLADKENGKPWITKLPFPVHVIERVETYDHISRNRFVTRYAYHHGYFDGVEREFRGFGMVEQFDTEEFAALSGSDFFPDATNIDQASHVPPVLTKTWFHTGAYINREHISDYFAGMVDGNDVGEYYREPGLTDEQAKELLLEDTILPDGLSPEEGREACRALKGAMLRQEVYALDGTPKAIHPFTVIEQNFTIRVVQPHAANRHAVFFTNAREALNYQYERNPSDPRIRHAVTLEVDGFGNALREISIAYPRANVPERQPEQNETHMTLRLNRFANRDDQADWYRLGLPAETRIYEVVKPPAAVHHFTWTELRDIVAALIPSDKDEPPAAKTIPFEQWDWRRQWNPQAEPGGPAITRLRLIKHVRTLYRADDLTDLLPMGRTESLALPGQTYNLAFTPGLPARVYQRPRNGGQSDNLLPDPANVLGGRGSEGGGYVDINGDNHWWIPSVRVFYSPGTGDSPASELTHARRHFFLPHRYRDPFHTSEVSTDTIIGYENYDLLMAETVDPLGNRITVGGRGLNDLADSNEPGHDYRVLQPALVTDPNGNRTEVAFDALGFIAGTAVKGKDDTMGDTLRGFEPDLTSADVDGFYEDTDPHVPAPPLLKDATTRILYDLDHYRRTRLENSGNPAQWLPAYTATFARETHRSDLLLPRDPKILIRISYSDGFGREIQKKIQAEPGPVVETGPSVSPRWVGGGWTIFNNKGKPIREYEPFFTNTHRFEFARVAGVSPILFYDPVDRVVVTLHPNHSWEKAVFNPWRQATYDANDTVAAQGAETGDPRTDSDIKGFLAGYFKTQPDTWQTWYQARITGTKGVQEKIAAEKAAKHSNTPTVAHFDALGRPFLTIAHNGFEPDGTPVRFPTRLLLDIEGNRREVRDAVEQNGDPRGRLVSCYSYDMLGNRIFQASMEAGERWMLNDATGKPLYAWDSRGHTFRTEYDTLRRPVQKRVIGGDGPEALDNVYEKIIYGEGQSLNGKTDRQLNLRGRPFAHYDPAGEVQFEEYDFKGNLLRSKRRLLRDYQAHADWAHDAAPQLENETFTGSTVYDALNRPIQLIAPHSDRAGTKVNVVQPVYNEANLLEQVNAWLNQNTELSGRLDPADATLHAVANIDYDAKGRRALIQYGNGAETRYRYDRDTFRLMHLYTRRGAAFKNDCMNLEPPPPSVAAPDYPPAGTLCGLQNLHYTYDPVGNITSIRDDAQETVYFNGQVVDPHSTYVYDAMYRLIEASGREHRGQAGRPWTLYNDAGRAGLPHPHDGAAMRNYTEQYEYDAVGNLLRLIHQAANGDWTRTYSYSELSRLEPQKRSNRLTSTSVGGFVEAYSTHGDGYDLHGNMLGMPHLPVMQWDFKDQLFLAQRQSVNADGPEHRGERTYYVYDAAGRRVRKVTVLATDEVKDESLYLDGFEIYRSYGTNAVVRETVHIMDDKQRIASVETKTEASGFLNRLRRVFSGPESITRYQNGNHLGTACLELDDEAQIISYEEYYPYGSTSYQAVRSQTETPKRYRYTGKERDEESGLYYHGARYYAPWLARWTATDPAGHVDGLCLYAFVRGNPLIFADEDGFEGKTVYLTFDDGPNRETTPVALNALDKEGVKATFYIQGNHVKGNEDILFDILKRGHFIGNHTFSHPTFADKDKKPLVSDEEIEEEFVKAETAIKEALKAQKALTQENNTWEEIPKDRRDYIDSIISNGVQEYRVPQFSQSKEQTAFMEKRFLKPRAANVDSKDADTIARDTSLSTSQKTEAVVDHIVNGIPDTEFKGVREQKTDTVIVLQHDTLRFSVDAIPAIIQKLKAEGHTFGGQIPPRSKPAPAPSKPANTGSRRYKYYADGTAMDTLTGRVWVYSARP